MLGKVVGFSKGVPTIVLLLLLLGGGGAADTEKYLVAAKMGDARAQFIVGLGHETSGKGAKDFVAAATWYGRAAAQRFAPAKAALGYLYQTGMGVARDDDKALTLYKLAANMGDVRGQFLLGVAYINGIGTSADAALAAKWLHGAAIGGHQQSQLMLAAMLQIGTGTARNEFAARRWLEKAANGPNPEIAAKAAYLRRQIDSRVLFSGPFRQESISALLVIGFGLAGLMSAIPSDGIVGYKPHQYHPLEDPQARFQLCRDVMDSTGTAAGCL